MTLENLEIGKCFSSGSKIKLQANRLSLSENQG